jgi:hypothetical protein
VSELGGVVGDAEQVEERRDGGSFERQVPAEYPADLCGRFLVAVFDGLMVKIALRVVKGTRSRP